MAFHPWLVRCNRGTLSPAMGTPVFAINIVESTYEYFDPSELRENLLRYEIAVFLRATKPGIAGGAVRKLVAEIVSAASPRVAGDIRGKRVALLSAAKNAGKVGSDYERLKEFVEANINSLGELRYLPCTGGGGPPCSL